VLAGKWVVITGANRGIGKAVAEVFAAEQAQLILFARTPGSLDETITRYESQGRTVKAVYCDVSDYTSLKQGFSSVLQYTKTLDVWVNNAGILGDRLLGMITPDFVEPVFSTNCFATLYCMQFASRLMVKQKSGSIINMSSIVANGVEGAVVYSGTKAAVEGMTFAAAKELAPHGIRVNAIAPGFIETDMTKNLPEPLFQKRMAGIKMNTIGQPWDVAQAALFLASEGSSYITGQVIGVDGCMSL
jgi:3-oxoacyl-[acyl-carrier protein] reductase